MALPFVLIGLAGFYVLAVSVTVYIIVVNNPWPLACRKLACMAGLCCVALDVAYFVPVLHGFIWTPFEFVWELYRT